MTFGRGGADSCKPKIVVKIRRFHSLPQGVTRQLFVLSLKFFDHLFYRRDELRSPPLTAQIPRDEDAVAIDDEAGVRRQQCVGDTVPQKVHGIVVEHLQDGEPGRRQDAAVVELERSIPMSQSSTNHHPQCSIQLNYTTFVRIRKITRHPASTIRYGRLT